MQTKDKVFHLIENYVNNFRYKELSEFYGKGTKVQIRTIGYSTNNKSLYVESHLTIGEDFFDEIIDTSLVEILISDSLKYLYPNIGINYIITFDS